MAETMILVPGRSSKQGTSLNKGKLKQEYLSVTSTLEMNSDDMQRLELEDELNHLLPVRDVAYHHCSSPAYL